MKKLKVYKLQNAMKDYSFFIEINYTDWKDSIHTKSIEQKWRLFDLNNFEIPEFKLHPSDTGKKNYRFDLSTTTGGFIIFSEKAVRFHHNKRNM